MPVVRLAHVDRSFGRTPAAVDISFEVEPGEVFALLGHNGAGKTTLLRLINGLLTPDRGDITVFGLDPVAEGRAVRRRTGVLTTYPGLDDYLSPRENLAVYAAINGLSRDEAGRRGAMLLSRLGLDPRSREPSRGLSAGLKQRVALARALVHEPELLLLDEPTANLDPIAARGVRELVRDMASDGGRTVIFSTHNLAEAEAIADRVAILRFGRLLAVGRVADLSKATFQPGLVLHVGEGQGPRAGSLLRDGPTSRDPIVHGDEVRLMGVDPGAVALIVRALVSADVDVQAAIPTRPSLEDVYLSVHEKAGMP